jgi:hypothetical protein
VFAASAGEVTPQQEFPAFKSSTGGVFTWSTQQLAFADAEGYCRQMGGHLATYSSIDEQAEVEQFYLDKVRGGWLFRVLAIPRSPPLRPTHAPPPSTAGLVPAGVPLGLLDGPQRHHLACLHVDGCDQQL